MKDDLDSYVEKRWGSWDKMYAAVDVDELVKEVFTLTQEIEKHRGDFDDGFNYAVAKLDNIRSSQE